MAWVVAAACNATDSTRLGSSPLPALFTRRDTGHMRSPASGVGFSSSAPGMALARSEDHWADRRMADCLDAMTVGIQHEGAVIVGVIMRPKPRRAIVAPPKGKRRHMKGINRRAVGSEETEMRAGTGRPHLGFAGDGEFDTERAWCCAIVGAAALAEIDDAYQPERTQCRVIKTATAVDVGDTQRDMIQHGIRS